MVVAAPTRQEKNTYDPSISYQFMLDSTLAYIDFGKADNGGYFDLEQALKDPQKLNLEQAIRDSHIVPEKDTEELKNQIMNHDWSGYKVKVIENKTAKALIIRDSKDDITVSFRGTQPTKIKEWLMDAEAWRVPFTMPNGESCKVHKGFLGEVIPICILNSIMLGNPYL